MDYKQLGYLFGKALCADNMDPEYYAGQIMNGLGLDDEARQAVYAGANSAIAEMPEETLSANLKKKFDVLLMDEDQRIQAGIADGFEVDYFTEGLSSVTEAYLPIRRQGDGTPEYNRGQQTGQKIMNAWNAATDAARNG